MSWRPEVQVRGEGDKWHSNGLRFATKEEAEASASDLYSRWTSTTAHRAAESDDPVNYTHIDGRMSVSSQESTMDEFSVYQFMVDGTQERVREFVSAQEAVQAARHYTDSVAVKLGFVERVIITDGGDSCVFEWKKGRGVTFPPEAAGRM